MFASVFSGIELLWDRQFGFLKETLVAPVSRVHVMFGRVLGGATTSMLQGVLVLVLALFLGFRPYAWYLVPAALLVAVLFAFLFAAFGMWLGTMVRDMQAFPLIINFVVMPMFFLSGAVFPLGKTASALKIVAAIDPMSYGVDALRALLTGTAHFNLALDLGVTVGLALALLLLASRSFSRMQV